MNKINFDELIHKLQNEIQFCDTCQPYDGGESIWVLGEKINLEYLFDIFQVSEKLRDEVFR